MKNCILFCLLISVCSAQQGLRTLTDVQGRTIDVRILAVRETSVFVQMLDGREFDIPFERLVMSDLIYLDSWEPPGVKTPQNPIESVVIIRAGESTGSGFFAHESGRTFLYTNQHVISNALDVKAVNSNGDEIELGALEVSNSQDMARYRVQIDEALRLTDEVQPEEAVTVLGNSEGAGVITSGKGIVKGIGPTEIEVDADFVPGNSGGPAVNKDGEVIGMATYMQKAGADLPDWVTEDTRYGGTRRFVLRPTRVNDWIAVDPAEYARQYQKIEFMQKRIDQAFWTHLVLSKGRGYVSNIPEDWEREILTILKNHNRRQERPDYQRVPRYYDGYYIGSSSRSTAENKDNSRRSNLRALERYAKSIKGEFYGLNSAKLHIEYFKENPYNGTKVLEQRIDELLRKLE